MEIQLNDRTAEVKIIEAVGHVLKVEIDGKIHELDYARVGDGIYSFLIDGKSIEMSVSDTAKPKTFEVKHQCYNFKAEIIDSEAKYQKSRKQSSVEDDVKTISSPMPGKVVKIPISIGDKVEAGDTLIVISAMKMESEYKAKSGGVVKEILVEEGSTIDGNQPLITLE
ncbi:MAG: biotin/lipoyl-binding protein [Bacteroidales bacterium]|nr:biotin/lipoyl-binding protein [Bacteroidales bacterium]